MPTPVLCDCLPFNLDEEIGRQMTGRYGSAIRQFIGGSSSEVLLPMKNGDYQTRVILCHVLQSYGLQSGDRLAITTLLGLTRDENEWVRAAAVWALGFTPNNDADVLQRLLEIAFDKRESVNVYFMAEEALREWGVMQ